MSRMSNQRKAEFVGDNFLCEVSGKVMAKFRKNEFYTGSYDLPENVVSSSGRFSDCHNSQIANRLEPFNGPSES
jgi:hypothetical protein